MPVYFKTDKKEASEAEHISEEGEKALGAIIEQLRSNDNLKLKIDGYASNRGSEEYNQDLSEQRAENVKAYILDRLGEDFDATRIETEGHGAPAAATSETDEEEDRRVEISIKS